MFVERFDEATLTELFGRWTDVLNGAGMSIGNDAPSGSPVESLNIPWSAASSGGHLYQVLSPGVDDTFYLRYYIKHRRCNNYQHTGIWMGGYNPPLPWPNPQAGTKPAGSDLFSASAEQNDNNVGSLQLLDGHAPVQRRQILGQPLAATTRTLQAAGDQWMCVEQMVKLNTPVTAANGEHAIWVNGVKVSHLGQGFPERLLVGRHFHPESWRRPRSRASSGATTRA